MPHFFQVQDSEKQSLSNFQSFWRLTGCLARSFSFTLPETNSKRHLKMDGWNTLVSFWDFSYFQGRTVSFREFFFNFFFCISCATSRGWADASFRLRRSGGVGNDQFDLLAPLSDEAILLMEEIPNNHLGCIKPCKWWDFNYEPQLVTAGFQAATVLVCTVHMCERVKIPIGTFLL